MPAQEMKAPAPRPPVRKISRVSRPAFSSLDDAPVSSLTLQRGEPADAFVTGATRSLQRRVLGLNIPSAVHAPADAAKKQQPVKMKHAAAS